MGPGLVFCTELGKNQKNREEGKRQHSIVIREATGKFIPAEPSTSAHSLIGPAVPPANDGLDQINHFPLSRLETGTAGKKSFSPLVTPGSAEAVPDWKRDLASSGTLTTLSYPVTNHIIIIHSNRSFSIIPANGLTAVTDDRFYCSCSIGSDREVLRSPYCTLSPV